MAVCLQCLPVVEVRAHQVGLYSCDDQQYRLYADVYLYAYLLRVHLPQGEWYMPEFSSKIYPANQRFKVVLHFFMCNFQL